MADDRDLRSGTFDPGTDKRREEARAAPAKETSHQAEQHQASVRSEPEIPQPESPLPEGLRREPKRPYGPIRGRGNDNKQ